MAYALVDTDLLVPAYGAISNLISTGPGPQQIRKSLTHSDCYMDDVISTVQGGPGQQHRFFDSTVRDIKWLLPSLPGEAKDSTSVKKLLTGEGGLDLCQGVPWVEHR